VLAWLYTGPLGHLTAGVADWLELLVRYFWGRGRRHLTDSGRRAN
jgi:hypothetical protein